MKNILTYIFIFSLFIGSAFSQIVELDSTGYNFQLSKDSSEIKTQKHILPSKINSFQAFSALTIEGGMTYVLSDFKYDGMGPAIGAMFEYFFPSKSGLVFGVKIGLGYLRLKGRSDFLVIAENPNINTLDFKTDVIYSSAMITLALGIKKFISYFSIGFDYLLKYTPKNNDGQYLLTNNSGQPFIWFSAEGGIKYFIKMNISANISAKFNFGKKDDLDGRISKKNDSYYTLKMGLSYYFFSYIRVK